MSVQGPYSGGELLTRPLRFSGRELRINFSTSAVGSLKLELQDAAGKPLPGFELENSIEIYGDKIDSTVAWKDRPDLSSIAGKPVRLRFVLKDADLFAIQFRD